MMLFTNLFRGRPSYIQWHIHQGWQLIYILNVLSALTNFYSLVHFKIAKILNVKIYVSGYKKASVSGYFTTLNHMHRPYPLKLSTFCIVDVADI